MENYPVSHPITPRGRQEHWTTAWAPLSRCQSAAPGGVQTRNTKTILTGSGRPSSNSTRHSNNLEGSHVSLTITPVCDLKRCKTTFASNPKCCCGVKGREKLWFCIVKGCVGGYCLHLVVINKRTFLPDPERPADNPKHLSNNNENFPGGHPLHLAGGWRPCRARGVSDSRSIVPQPQGRPNYTTNF